MFLYEPPQRPCILDACDDFLLVPDHPRVSHDLGHVVIMIIRDRAPIWEPLFDCTHSRGDGRRPEARVEYYLHQEREVTVIGEFPPCEGLVDIKLSVNLVQCKALRAISDERFLDLPENFQVRE